MKRYSNSFSEDDMKILRAGLSELHHLPASLMKNYIGFEKCEVTKLLERFSEILKQKH